MQFLLLGYDGTDVSAPTRRSQMRSAHLNNAQQMKEQGTLLYAAAILDEEQHMIGSCMILEFPAQEELDQYLANEPYVQGNVWHKITISPCAVPQFVNC